MIAEAFMESSRWPRITLVGKLGSSFFKSSVEQAQKNMKTAYGNDRTNTYSPNLAPRRPKNDSAVNIRNFPWQEKYLRNDDNLKKIQTDLQLQ
jgi:hypothetical protein